MLIGNQEFKSVTETDAEKHHPGRKIKSDNTKLYYLGNLTYFDEVQLNDNTKQAYDISTSAYSTVNIDDLKKVKLNKSTDTQYLPLWNFVSKNHLKQQNSGGSSNPPDNNNTFITNPSLYESGYTSSSSKDLPGYNLTYFLMSSFDSGEDCYPTAATNLCYYLYNSNKTKYSKLLLSSGWQGVYNRFTV